MGVIVGDFEKLAMELNTNIQIGMVTRIVSGFSGIIMWDEVCER